MTNIEKVKTLYDEGYGVTEISVKLQMKSPNVSMYLNKAYGKDRIKHERCIYVNRKYTLKEDYFEKIDSEDKAYFLGLLYADGCMSKTSNAIQLALQEEDKPILDTFKTFIESNKPLGFIKSSIVKGFDNLTQDYYRKNQYILVICSPKIKSQLLKLGMTPHKSLTILFPDFLEKSLYSHFIRGYFDGDGSINTGSKNRWGISIAGNENFCQSLQVKLELVNIKTKIEKHTFLNVFYNKISGRLNCIDFYNFIYKDSSIYLNRKFNKFQDCINSTNMIRYGNSWKKKNSINT